MDHLVQFSGGVGSWATAKRVRERMDGDDTLTLLFADTQMEDEDLYRFLEEAAENVQGNLVKIADGRDVWEIFEHVKFIGNARIDPCSKILKRELLKAWIEENREPASTVVYLGIDWTEIHRYERAVPRWKPWNLQAPLTEPPLLDREEIFEQLKQEGIEVPRLYKMGFPHNNCGGFCVKAGAGQFAHLLKMFPERFAFHEKREQDLRKMTGKNITILRKLENGVRRPMTLRELRERVERGEKVSYMDFSGGCGCAID